MIIGLALLMAHQQSVPALIPSPRIAVWSQGAFYGHPRLIFDSSIATKDQRWLRNSLTPVLSPFDESDEPLTFRIDPQIQGEEAYRLAVTPTSITAKASSPKGLYWAIQTLRQLRHEDVIPCVEIQDAPAFKWRGIMLDEARHFLGETFTKHFIDVMTQYKFNTLHWHLTDDQGWRIEIKSHPELTKIGAWRKEADGKKSGGFYTQKQIKEIVAYAASKNITVVPEIEMPGHSSAAIVSNPNLSCFGRPTQVPNSWGVFGDVYCPGKETTFAFIQDVVNEVAPLFPSHYLHLGGDEVPKASWQQCPACQARIKQGNLKDAEALQGYFTNRAAGIVTAAGCTPIGWDEVIRGGAPSNMVVQIWNSQKIAQTAIQGGHQVVLSPTSNCYLDYSQADLTLAKVYAYLPLQSISDPTKVLGIEAPLWSERITTKNCMAMFLPRGLAISEVAWSNPEKNWNDFSQRVTAQLAVLDKQKIAYGPSDKSLVKYSISPNLANGAAHVQADFGLSGTELRYTLNGSTPEANSRKATNIVE